MLNGFGNGDDVGWSATFKQTRNLLINQFVFTAIEINFCQQISNTIQRLVIE